MKITDFTKGTVITLPHVSWKIKVRNSPNWDCVSTDGECHETNNQNYPWTNDIDVPSFIYLIWIGLMYINKQICARIS